MLSSQNVLVHDAHSKSNDQILIVSMILLNPMYIEASQQHDELVSCKVLLLPEQSVLSILISCRRTLTNGSMNFKDILL